MLFRNALFLSALLTTSAFATSIHPLLATRQISNCQSQCGPVVQKLQGNSCDLACICTASVINALGACVNCATQNGVSIPGVGPDYVQNLVNSCKQAGYPVSGVNSGGGSGGSTGGGSTGSDSGNTSSGLSGTGLSGGTGGGATTTGGLGGGSLTTGGAGSQTTAPASTGGNGGGLTLKNGATGSTARLGVVAAAIAGVFVLAA